MATNLPSLTGSAKQIAWAEDIRKTMLEDKVQGIRIGDIVEKYFSWAPEKQQQFATLAKAESSNPLSAAYFIATETSAKWFIDNRPHGSIKAGGRAIMSW